MRSVASSDEPYPVAMRIGIDYRAALHASDGIARYTRELVRALVELAGEDEIELFGSTWREPARSGRELEAAIGNAKLRRRRVPSRFAAWWMRASGGGADRWLGDVDVFHHTQAHAMPIASAREVATLHDCLYLETPEFVTARNAERMTESARRVAARAAAVIVPSRFAQGQVERFLGVPRERIHVIPLGVDHVPRVEAKRDGNVLTVARIETRKNHVAMLRAFERLVHGGFGGRWIVAGERGFGAEEFELALANSSVRERVDVLGAVDETQLAQLYATASAFLFLSRAEGFGLPPLEAMAAGLAVVSSRATSLGEVCGDAAWCVEPDDVDGAAEGLRRVFAEPDFAADLVRRGHARAAEHTWRRAASETLALYRAVVAGRVAK
ncbi:MAG: glycosyltransferase family 4 protein [Planctomycetes bacterium]|nr:glycosyltransferase family 4 protein [Planctomycetota bacterium]